MKTKKEEEKKTAVSYPKPINLAANTLNQGKKLAFVDIN